jgi:hypothetical protein
LKLSTNSKQTIVFILFGILFPFGIITYFNSFIYAFEQLSIPIIYTLPSLSILTLNTVKFDPTLFILISIGVIIAGIISKNIKD